MAEEKDNNTGLVSRPPIVVVLGHVDSGKTSILDAVRKAHVAEKESGGITQHVGAYEAEVDGKKITFIDTPGHEAFSAMRSRGAKVADIAILVVDSIAGIQPQTKEAIGHVKKAGIGLMIALNKVDLPGVIPEKIKQELMKEGIQVESLGGKTPFVEVSAKTGKGIDALLEMILLMAEMADLKTDSGKPAEGVVIEAYLDSLRGPVATILLREGKLRIGDVIGTQTTCGKIKAMEDFQRLSLTEVLPSMPVVILGLESVPQVGDKVKIFPGIDEAKLYVQKKERKSADSPIILIEEGKKALNLILKADVLGSLEAIEEVLAGFPHDKIVLRILNKGVGEVNESDVKLAEAGKAVVVAFRVKTNSTALAVKERLKTRILSFEIIYALAKAVRQLMENALDLETERRTVGRLKVLAIFKTDKNRQIIGGKVIEGEIKKGAKLEVWHEEQSLGRGKLVSLQENKKDVVSAAKGRECGILFEGGARIVEGDILEAFEEEKHKAELE
ncbi:MAG: translation initiation factor IF-2 [bacterium]|nr:translation initiation factor IF-2 [bacterium]